MQGHVDVCENFAINFSRPRNSSRELQRDFACFRCRATNSDWDHREHMYHIAEEVI